MLMLITPKNFKKQLAVAALAGSSLFAASFSYALTPFTASYDFNLDNKANGTATRSLSKKKRAAVELSVHCKGACCCLSQRVQCV